VLFATARADYRADIGYTKLALELGAALPTGSGVGVTHTEAPEQTINGTKYYLPDTTLAELLGKTFTILSPAGGVSGHATTVAQYYYGSATSVAPGVTNIHSYEANNWVFGSSPTGFLNLSATSPPDAETQTVENNSWIGTIDNGGPGDVEALRRFDYAIQQSGFLGVVALNNGNAGNVPPLLASCYNGVSVGRSDGGHSYGTNTADGAGRSKPELVAPAGATSFSTPMVASAAAMLSQGAPANATQPVTMKAILMAGATKSQFGSWSRSLTHPLDAVYGAGQLNVYNSWHILAAGQQAASASAAVRPLGWDWNTTAIGSRLYFFDIAAGDSSPALSVILTWNRTIAGPFPSATSSLATLTLNLYSASGFTVGALVDSSASTVDNVQHMYEPTLAPGRYAIEVVGNQPGVTYGLAWYSLPVVTVVATAPSAAKLGLVPGAFTITRGGDTGAPILVNFTIGGTATAGADYVSIPASVTIPAGANSATVTVTPVADDIPVGATTVVLTLAPQFSYAIGAAAGDTVTIQDTPFNAWRFANFTAADLANPSLTGDLADYDGDGIVNLLEYAFGLAPKTPDVSGLPLVGIQPGGALSLAYTHVKGAADITYIAEVSNDLSTWNSGAAYMSVIGTADHGATETVTVASLLAPGPAQRQYMRVRITRP